jgi:predicted transcriptional regulator
LLQRDTSYGIIVKELSLKKTAVSNHLTQLLNTKLIERGDYGIYKITGDGIEILKGIEKAYKQSPSRKIERFQDLQRRSVSKSFVNRFSHQSSS